MEILFKINPELSKLKQTSQERTGLESLLSTNDTFYDEGSREVARVRLVNVNFVVVVEETEVNGGADWWCSS